MNNELKMLMLSVMMTIVTIDRVDWLWKIYGHWAIRAITDQKNYVTNPMSGNAFLQEISMKDKDKLKWFSKVNINLANSIGDEETITWWYICAWFRKDVSNYEIYKARLWCLRMSKCFNINGQTTHNGRLQQLWQRPSNAAVMAADNGFGWRAMCPPMCPPQCVCPPTICHTT